LQVYDLLFRPMFAFFIVELGSRRVVHVGVTRAPSDAWVAQQLREATPFGTGPKYLIRDNDDKYGAQFKRVAARIKILKTPVHAPKANSICERFLGSVRRECLDHFLILSERHLQRIVTDYVSYFTDERPCQGYLVFEIEKTSSRQHQIPNSLARHVASGKEQVMGGNDNRLSASRKSISFPVAVIGEAAH
jgi:hypothetical protein